MTRIHYRTYKKYALHLFILSIIVTLLVFIPGLGFTAGGATRWIDLGFTTFQPAELLKLGFVIYLAALLSNKRTKLHSFRHGVLPLAALSAVVGIILLLQPDTGTFLVILATGLAMFIAAGSRWRDIASLGGMAIAGLSVLALFRPYVMDRILTFLNPATDPLGSSYQIQQSLIAVGSGHFFGRGFGQSVQKFDYLPEPIGDSIFAVFAEEFGFIGSLVLLALFLFFALRGLKIASHAPDQFGGLLVAGIVILIVSQSFINIGSLIGIFPLTGLPLLFVSHGGTALFFALVGVGIVLNVSRYTKLNT
jgi:cell division protein FtsW